MQPSREILLSKKIYFRILEFLANPLSTIAFIWKHIIRDGNYQSTSDTLIRLSAS